MNQFLEYSWDSLNKHGEELCGDSVIIRSKRNSFVAVLSDGLGSGVKANILSTLTAEIAAKMFESGGTVEDVMQTLVQTLPECSIRKIAYATFAVLIVYNGKDAQLVEFDCPPVILIRNGNITNLPFEEHVINDRLIRETRFALQENDYMVMMSDGYEHAGLGGIYRLGWGWENVAMSVQRFVQTGMDTEKLKEALSRTCLKLYSGKPGDDSTIICIKVRPPVSVTVMTGPPANKEMDSYAVTRLMTSEGDKIICGGSTAQMVAREIKKELEVEWVPPWKRKEEDHAKPVSPPTAKLEGVNLVTEGILTIGKTVQLLEKANTIYELPADNDAATRLARYLLDADYIHLIIGTAINPNQVADLIRGESMRMVYIRELIQILNNRNKQVTVEKV